MHSKQRDRQHWGGVAGHSLLTPVLCIDEVVQRYSQCIELPHLLKGCWPGAKSRLYVATRIQEEESGGRNLTVKL